MIAFIIGSVLAIIIGIFSFMSFNSHNKSMGVLLAVIAAIVFASFTAITPYVNVWQKTLAGEAELKQAEWNRQIKVKEAQAAKDAAVSLADAEVARAKGVAEANKIIAGGLGGSEGYLRYLYIQAMEKASEKGTMQFVYIPTEGGLPILEAGRIGSSNSPMIQQ